MVPLGDEAQVEACFDLFGDRANLDARLLHGLCRTCHRLRNRLDAPNELLCNMGHVESRFFPFGDRVSVGAR